MKNIRVLLVEDSHDYREVIAFGLQHEQDISVDGQFSTADAALRHLGELPRTKLPDVILLDLNLPGISGLESIPRFKQLAKETPILVLTESDKEADIFSALSAGAAGYLLKEMPLDEIISGIRIVRGGGAPIDPSMARYLLDAIKIPKLPADEGGILSTRETEILILVAAGDQQKQIASSLSISRKTVDFHIGNIYKKLNVQNAPAAVSKAYQTGLLPRGRG